MASGLIVGIDATNLRQGGGVTHLVELLRAAKPEEHGISKIAVWGGTETLEALDDRPWLAKLHHPELDKGLLQRMFWQRFKLSRAVREASCDLLFVPGGSYAGSFKPVVTMSQNLLPFEWREMRRFGWSWLTLKLLFLRYTQGRTFRRVDGLIFLTQYARNVVLQVIKTTAGRTITIPHGIDGRFACVPREQMAITRYSLDRPFRILYVSVIDMYKHQWNVAEAIARLRKSGLPVVLDLVGPSRSCALTLLRRKLDSVDSTGKFVRCAGNVPYTELHSHYAKADLCLFASSCENMPNILLEGMASGLPNVCSNRGPMPEMLGDAGIYFDPENPQDIARALREFIDSPELRAAKAKRSFERARAYSWQRCADETFGFLVDVARDATRNRAC